MPKKVFTKPRRYSGFPACVTHSGRDSPPRRTTKERLSLNPIFSNDGGVLFFRYMVTVYVIESFKDGIWYTGIAANAEARLKEHNVGKNRFTKGHKPWNIIYAEQHPS